VTLGGSADENTSVGEIIGRGFISEEITDAIEQIVDTYLGLRLDPTERFNRRLPPRSVPRRSRRRSMLAKPKAA